MDEIKKKLRFERYAANGDLDGIEEMLESGFQTTLGAIENATASGHSEVLKKLLSASMFSSEKLGGRLNTAIQHGHLTCMLLLLNAGANPNDGLGEYLSVPPLLTASERGYAECVQSLLKYGASPDAYDAPVGADLLGIEVHRTALMVAAIKGRFEIVRLLLEAGSDPTIKGIKGKTAYELVAKRKDRQDIAKLLLNWKQKKLISKTKPAHETTKKYSLQRPTSTWKDVLANLEELCGAPPATHPQGKRIQAFSLPGKRVFALIKRENHNLALSARDYEQVLELARAKCGSVKASVFLSFDGGAAQICATPWKDKLKTIATMKTASANYGVATTELVAVLRQVDSLCPFELTECGIHSLGGVFTAPVKNAKKIAAILFDVCPFVVDKHSGKLTRFQQALPRERRFNLWWD